MRIPALILVLFAVAGCVTDRKLTPQQKAVVSTLQGVVLGAKGNNTAAIDRASFAIAENPLYAPAYILRGWLWLKEQEPERARKDAEFARGIAPKNPGVYNLLGTIAMEENTPDEALSLFTKAIDLNPGLSSAFSNRAQYWLLVKDFDRALHDLDTAIRLNEKSAAALRSRAIVWMAKGEYGNAAQDLSRAHGLQPNNSGTYNNEGVLHLMQGEFALSIKQFDQAIKHSPENALYLANRARTWLLLGKYGDALEDFRRAEKRSLADKHLPLFVYMAMNANGMDGKTYLTERRQARPGNDWPSPLYDLMLDRLAPDALLGSIPAKPTYRVEDRTCEANFFIAHYYADRGQSRRAVAHFRKAAASRNRVAYCYTDSRGQLLKQGILDRQANVGRQLAVFRREFSTP